MRRKTETEPVAGHKNTWRSHTNSHEVLYSGPGSGSRTGTGLRWREKRRFSHFPGAGALGLWCLPAALAAGDLSMLRSRYIISRNRATLAWDFQDLLCRIRAQYGRLGIFNAALTESDSFLFIFRTGRTQTTVEIWIFPFPIHWNEIFRW